MHQSRDSRSPALTAPLPLVIGVTGHRDLRPVDREALEGRVRAIFVELQNRYPATLLVLLSPLAEGADRLVARVALSCGVSLIVPLPMAQDLYETDFETPASLAEFRDLLQQAEAWFELAPAVDGVQEAAEMGGASRDRLYAQVGAYIVRNCQILIALWDGVDSGREGGTAQVVRFKLEGIPESDPLVCSPIEQPETGPVYHIATPRVSNPHPNGEPPTLQKLVPRASLEGTGKGSDRTGLYPGANVVAPDAATPYDRIYRRMNTFNKDAVTLAPRLAVRQQSSRAALLPASEVENIRAPLRHELDCYATADALAQHFQHRRNGTLLTLLGLLTSAVIIFQIYSLIRDNQEWKGGPGPQILVGLYLGSLAVAYTLYLWAKWWGDYDNKYFDYRALAEGLRVQIFWRIAGLRDSVADHYLRKQRSELDWIRNAIRAGRILVATGEDARIPELSSGKIGERLRLVLRNWVTDQAEYFQRAALGPDKANHRMKILGHGLYLVSLALAFLKVLYHFSDMLTIVMPLILAIAALAGVYAKIMAFSEHAKRYRWMNILYENARCSLNRLMEAGRYAEAQNLLRELGREALIENSDWVLLHRDRPLEFQAR